jgi:uncharacterized protein YqgC (DUF456 family)
MAVDLTQTETVITVIAGIAIFIGLLGIVVPVLPGLLLTWAGVLLWALFGNSSGWRWVVLAVATIIVAAGEVVKYAWPGRNLKRNGIPTLSLLVGGVLGIVGFFVVPVVGLILGFVLGVFLAELARLRQGGPAWRSTVHALKAAGLSMLIELGAGGLVAGIWVASLFVL